MSTYLEQSLAKLEEFEGCIPWMYRDTVGKVTTAVGLMLPDPAAAGRLPFQLAGTAVSAAEIAAEYARVDALPMGRPALFYREVNPALRIELTRPEIDALLRSVVLGFEQHLRTGLPAYDALPDPAKLALLDMAYNLGPDKLFKQFVRLIQAVEAGDWQLAAQRCSRRGPSAARNEWTRQQFLSLVPVVHSLKAEAARTERPGSGHALKNLGFGLIGLTAAAASATRRWFNTPR